jgi:hypothetical protein
MQANNITKNEAKRNEAQITFLLKEEQRLGKLSMASNKCLNRLIAENKAFRGV